MMEKNVEQTEERELSEYTGGGVNGAPRLNGVAHLGVGKYEPGLH